MAHNVETMAYAGETPWHGLGKPVPNDLTPAQMLEAAQLDWTVSKVPAFANIGGDGQKGYKRVAVGWNALVRSSDNSILDIVSDSWNPVQNEEAFEFFADFIAAGNMEMHTAGSLKDGQIVWGLAKVTDGFDLFGGDTVESHLLFTNYHRYGFSTDVRFTPIRVVCNNTLTLALGSKVEKAAKFSHRRAFNPDVAKEALGIAHEKLESYKEMAAFLGSKRYSDENVVEYFKRIFPITGQAKEGAAKRTPKEISKNAKIGFEILETQPGAKYAEGTWWQAFNAVTYMTDHVMGRTEEGRLTSAWYGPALGLKEEALKLAVEMADA